jgi:hypothetical protein
MFCQKQEDGEDMDGEMGLAAALHAMAPENGRSRGDWAMFSALPDAPVHEARSTRERIVGRIERLVRRVRTGRSELSRDRAGRRARTKHRPVCSPRPV